MGTGLASPFITDKASRSAQRSRASLKAAATKGPASRSAAARNAARMRSQKARQSHMSRR